MSWSLLQRKIFMAVLTVVLSGWAALAGAEEPDADIGSGDSIRERPYVVVVNNAPPFRLIEAWDDKSGYSGAYIDTVNEISRRTGLPLEFRNVPFARALAMMQAGRADMMLGPTWSIERADFMYYLNAAFPAEAKVFYLAPNSSDITRYRDLLNREIGVLRSARYFDPFDDDDRISKYKLDRYEAGFKMLSRGRLDALIIPERQGRFLSRDMGFNFRTASFRIPGLPSFITVSRNSRLLEHKEVIEKAMTELNAEGFFQRLISTYLE